MTEYSLSNGLLTAKILRHGAELCSLKNAEGKEFIFRDTSIWNGSAPVLFPVCGGLRDDKFVFEGKEYEMPKHGFAKLSDFEAEKIEKESATFLLKDTEETRKIYPFSFEFRVRFTLHDDSLVVEYITKNTGKTEMYYSVGAHEAYLCPEGIEQYALTFDKKETLDAHFVRGTLVDHETYPVLKGEDTLPLRYRDYAVDALVFSRFHSHGATLSANDGSRILRVDFPDSTHLLLWTTHNVDAPYICIEPWNGMPDFIDSDYDIRKRPGILSLEAGEEKTVTHTITVIK